MTPLDTPIVTAEKMAAGGDAIARMDDGRVVFVSGALPGERVRVAVHAEKRDFAKATVTEVLQPSVHRVAAPCPELARGCGGCSWQHIDPAAQAELKAEIVVDALRRTAKIADPRVVLGGAVPPWGYRTTMRLAVDGNGRLGLRATGSHRIVSLSECPVAHPALAGLIPQVRAKGAAEVSLRVSVASGEATAICFDDRGRPVDVPLSGVPDHVAVGPTAALHESVAGSRLRVTAASFFQSGPAAAELLVRTVAAACGSLLHEAGTLLDAYGGVGLFAATLGDAAPVLVESSPAACADARVNVPGAQIACMPFEDWAAQPVRVAVADPARAGLGTAATAVLTATGAARVVLVSCDPVSLARDSTLLAANGYDHAGSTVLDLFPHTSHVEVVTVFERRHQAGSQM